ncbi:MAG: ORF6N domain-containing protein [Anaerotignum faecicola]
MNGVITIENTEMQIREYNGERVVTFKDIDMVHQRADGTASRNFRKNKKHFIEGVDYIRRNSSEAKREYDIIAPNGLTLVTESGYLLLVKSFTDDLSWKVQRQLVDVYFKVREVQKEPYYKEPLADDFTPRVPIVSDWYERNKGRMYRLCRDSGNSRSYLYHCILNRLSERYDLNAAREIYKNEVGSYPEYPIDIVKYFPELEQDADKFLDRIERMTYR